MKSLHLSDWLNKRSLTWPLLPPIWRCLPRIDYRWKRQAGRTTRIRKGAIFEEIDTHLHDPEGQGVVVKVWCIPREMNVSTELVEQRWGKDLAAVVESEGLDRQRWNKWLNDTWYTDVL